MQSSWARPNAKTGINTFRLLARGKPKGERREEEMQYEGRREGKRRKRE
jgi:hypothetical protein